VEISPSRGNATWASTQGPQILAPRPDLRIVDAYSPTEFPPGPRSPILPMGRWPLPRVRPPIPSSSTMSNATLSVSRLGELDDLCCVGGGINWEFPTCLFSEIFALFHPKLSIGPACPFQTKIDRPSGPHLPCSDLISLLPNQKGELITTFANSTLAIVNKGLTQ
jgi:hypothetical protein